MSHQASLFSFSAEDPVWVALVLSQDGRHTLTRDDKNLRSQRGDRMMQQHTCIHCQWDAGKAYRLQVNMFTGFCKLKEQRPDLKLPTFCSAQHWPYYLCPNYLAREK